MTTGTTIKRATRVSERVREEIAQVLARNVSDPRLEGAMISRVEMPDDLQMARIFVRLVAGGEDPDARKRLLAGFEAASRRFRGRIAQMGLRRIPELRFVYDEGLDASSRVEEILHEIAKDRSKA